VKKKLMNGVPVARALARLATLGLDQRGPLRGLEEIT
jgi:hypothetical protein